MEKIFHEDSSEKIEIDVVPVFERLNLELKKENQSLTLICAGGFVMQLKGYRGTIDIDAFYETNAIIDEIIRKVGDEFRINSPEEVWLNNSFSNRNPKPLDEYCETIHQFSNLTIKAVTLLYLIGMKLSSARKIDIRDVAEIVKNHDDFQPLELLSKLTEMNFSIDISNLLTAFEGARGMFWLEKYYADNEAELSKYF